MDLAAAAPLMCGGVTVYAALTRARVKAGDWVLVAGAGGGLGHLGIQYAKALGARVLALDAGGKAAFCKEVGADAFVDFREFPSTEALRGEIKRISGGGVKIVLQCVSTNAAYDQAMGWLGFRGTLVCLGVPEKPPRPIAGAMVGAMIQEELGVFALKAGNQQEAKQCLEIAASGKVKTRYQVRKMEELTQVSTKS